MTAPAPEAIEKDQARDENMPHVFCIHCWGEGRVEKAVALCGTVALKRGYRGPGAGDDCVVCIDLWSARPSFRCLRCGQVPE